MKTVTLSSHDPEVLAVLDQARGEDIVLKLADGSEFLLAAIDDFDLEVAAASRNEKLMEFLDRRTAQHATIPINEVKRRLGLS